MKKKITTAMMIAAMSMSIMACGSTSETQTPASTEAATEVTTEAATETQTEAATEAAESDDGIIDFEASDHKIKYEKHEFGTDYEGNPCLLYYYAYTNNTDENANAASTVMLQCFQNGIECDLTSLDEETDEIANFYRDVQPGTSLEVCEVFKLQDNSEITMEESDWISVDGSKDTQKITVE